MSASPARLEVLRHRLGSVADAMGATLQRAAYSPNIKERLDFSCAVFDAQGRLLAQAAHIPVHLGAMPASVESANDQVERWSPGDLVVLNDPHRGGSHLPDITTVSPVFDAAGQLRFLVATRAHHADVGGSAPGSLPIARDLYGEGLIIPPLHLVRAGARQEDVIRLICANSRTPEERRGDLDAQLAAHAYGNKALQEVIAREGSELEESCTALLAHARDLASAALIELAEGVYEAEDRMEGDGWGTSPTIHAKIALQDGRIEVDFAGSSPATAGGINAPLAVARSAVYYILGCLLGAVPINEGSLSVATIRAPEGSLVNPPPGAAVAAGNVETSQRIVDVLLQALAPAFPERIPACSQGTMNNLMIGGVDSRRTPARPFAYYETMAGGAGAGPLRRGSSGIQVHMTNTRNTPVEALESAYPLRVEFLRLRRGSGGQGRHSGGDGIERGLRFLALSRVTLVTERRESGPPGQAGGHDGRAGENVLLKESFDAGSALLPGQDGDGDEGEADTKAAPFGETDTRVKLSAKSSFDARPGDLLIVRTPGGGGWGEPLNAPDTE